MGYEVFYFELVLYAYLNLDFLMSQTILQCLTGALRNDNPRMLMAASAFLLPLRPFTVSALHTGMMEVTFRSCLCMINWSILILICLITKLR